MRYIQVQFYIIIACQREEKAVSYSLITHSSYLLRAINRTSMFIFFFKLTGRKLKL